MMRDEQANSGKPVTNGVNGADGMNGTNGANGAAASGLSGMSELAGMLDDHKGKLAIGVAATLGLMVFYSWREKKLAKEDPEAHALHQRSKAIVKAAESKASRLEDDIVSGSIKPAAPASKSRRDTR